MSSEQLVPIAAAAGGEVVAAPPSSDYTAAAKEALATARTVNFITVSNGPGKKRQDDEEEEVREEEERVYIHPEGSRLGRCMYAKCKHPKGKDIMRDYSATGENMSSYVCSNDCGRVCIHDECAEKLSLESDQVGTEIKRPCERCGEEIRISTEVALVRVVLHWFIGWPWFLLSKVLPALLVAGFVFKLYWFSCVVGGHYAVDAWNNPALVLLSATVSDPEAAEPLVRKPSFTIADFRAYNFCKPSNLDWMCAMFSNNCDGMEYCSRGGLGFYKFYRVRLLAFYLPFAVPLVEYGHGMMGLYFILYFGIVPYYTCHKWKWHERVWNRMSNGFRRTKVRKIRVGGASGIPRRRNRR